MKVKKQPDRERKHIKKYFHSTLNACQNRFARRKELKKIFFLNSKSMSKESKTQNKKYRTDVLIKQQVKKINNTKLKKQINKIFIFNSTK